MGKKRETSTGTPAGHDGIERFSSGKKKERKKETSTEPKKREKKETSTGTPAGTRRNQQIIMEQNPFPEERKKKEEGRQAPEPQSNQEEPANHEETKAISRTENHIHLKSCLGNYNLRYII